jgi:hypothetical protein
MAQDPYSEMTGRLSYAELLGLEAELKDRRTKIEAEHGSSAPGWWLDGIAAWLRIVRDQMSEIEGEARKRSMPPDEWERIETAERARRVAIREASYARSLAISQWELELENRCWDIQWALSKRVSRAERRKREVSAEWYGEIGDPEAPACNPLRMSPTELRRMLP